MGSVDSNWVTNLLVNKTTEPPVPVDETRDEETPKIAPTFQRWKRVQIHVPPTTLMIYVKMKKKNKKEKKKKKQVNEEQSAVSNKNIDNSCDLQ